MTVIPATFRGCSFSRLAKVHIYVLLRDLFAACFRNCGFARCITKHHPLVGFHFARKRRRVWLEHMSLNSAFVAKPRRTLISRIAFCSRPSLKHAESQQPFLFLFFKVAHVPKLAACVDFPACAAGDAESSEDPCSFDLQMISRLEFGWATSAACSCWMRPDDAVSFQVPRITCLCP